jgi:trk system potassium uptake protein TrkH
MTQNPPTVINLTRLSPARILVLGFLGTISAGTILLCMPFCQASGKWGSILDMFFTATSAVCVTGLVVVDTSTYFTRIGHIVIMLLIQIGGLGYMTAASIIFIIIGKRLGFHDLLTLKHSLGAFTISGAKKLLAIVFGIVVVFELIGAVLLSISFIRHDGTGEGIFSALFHSISAFNNAGFSLYSDNLVGFRSDPIVIVTVALLIIIGGIGFLVIHELLNRPKQGLSLHTRVVLITTAILIVAGMAAIWLFEGLEPSGDFAQLSLVDKFLNSFFASVTPRTAGFNTIDYASLHRTTLVLTVILMVIGASPGGTGGGIKTTTFALTALSSFSTLKGLTRTAVFRRKIAAGTIITAFSLLFCAMVTLLTGSTILIFTEKCDPLVALFECASALGTVGLSMGITPFLTMAGKILIVMLMLIGRVGPITFGLAMFKAEEKGHIGYPIEDVLIG